MDAPDSAQPANGRDRWDPATLNYAIRELRREFPSLPAERIAAAVDHTARDVPPSAGSVVLLQRARERLGAP